MNSGGKVLEATAKKRKILSGKVVSNKMQKTVVVEVRRRFRHPFFGKTIERVKKYKAHDEKNECKVGDVVKIIETRPLSREKKFRLLEIVGK